MEHCGTLVTVCRAGSQQTALGPSTWHGERGCVPQIPHLHSTAVSHRKVTSAVTGQMGSLAGVAGPQNLPFPGMAHRAWSASLAAGVGNLRSQQWQRLHPAQ